MTTSMLKNRTVLVTCLLLLTIAQLYVIYEILWFGWLTAIPVQHAEIARRYAIVWELISVPIGLLWVTCLIALVRATRKRIAAR
jgi:hypothetical protein